MFLRILILALLLNLEPTRIAGPAMGNSYFDFRGGFVSSERANIAALKYSIRGLVCVVKRYIYIYLIILIKRENVR